MSVDVEVTARRELVSVVIAVYNGERFVARAIESVRAQTYSDVELVVVDDGSTDATASEVERSRPDRFIRLASNAGVSTARNVGTAVATGSLITYLDADDEMFPEKIATQVARLAAEPPCDCVVTHQKVVVDAGAELPRWLEMDLDHLTKPTKLPISALIRTDSLLTAGGFDPSFRTAEEMGVLMRLARSGAVVETLPDVLITRHVHGRNATYDLEQMDRDILRAVALMTRRDPGPLVSVVIPVRNGAAYLPEALLSVRAQNGVDPRDVEVIVIDDGSTDASADLAVQVDPSATVMRQPPLGPGAARNHGVLLSRGRNLSFLDADDVWPSDRLRGLLDRLDPGVDVAFGAVEEFVSPELDEVQRARFRPRPQQPSRMPTAMVIRREAFARVGMFTSDPHVPDAAVWYAEAVDAGLTMADVSDVVVHRRLHGGNHSLLMDMTTTSYPGVLKDIIDRRRERSP